jgi:hypothetical protein
VRHGSRLHSQRGANGGTSPLPAGKVWHSHSGPRQRMRILRRSWAAIEALCAKDPQAKAARERLLDAVAEDPDSEFAALHLGHTALLSAQDCRVSWTDAVNHLLNKLEENAAADPGLGIGPDGAPPDEQARRVLLADLPELLRKTQRPHAQA